MITNTDLFEGLLKVNFDNISSYANNIINQKEPELLKYWFGYELAKDIQADAPSTAAQALIDGFEYTDDSGYLQEIIPLSKILCYFMYFYIVRDEQTYNTSTGERLAQVENSEKAQPAHKMVYNYNQAVSWLNDMINYVDDNSDTYTTADTCGYLDKLNVYGI